MSPQGPWYVELFESEDYLRLWLGGEGTPRIAPERTQKEVDFLVQTLELPAGARVLDLCCGHGRHSIALARLGYRVTGLDLAARHLEMAAKAAAQASVEVDWVRADMREIPEALSGRMDAVINMFTAFGYLESDEEDQKVLDAVSRALKPGGKLFIDFINREAVIRRFMAKDWELIDDTLVLHERRFDFMSGRIYEELKVVEPEGRQRQTGTVVRLYTLTELARMLAGTGLEVAQTFGDFEGGDLTMDSRRMIVLAEKR